MRTITGELGWCVAQLWVNDEGKAYNLRILSASETDEYRYAPAESVSINGRDSIVKLMEFLNQHICAHEQPISPKETPCQPTDAN